MHVRIFASRYKSYRPCEECQGKRFKPEALAYRLQDQTIADLLSMQADEVSDFFSSLQLETRELQIAEEPVRQVTERLDYLKEVGLGYLQLDRTLRTLSGGETQRVALTSALGSSLVNMLYVLDEPSIGLHQRDNDRLLSTLVKLRDLGNTLIVVEHDEDTIRAADHIVDIGPGAGVNGGEIIAQGDGSTAEETYKYLFDIPAGVYTATIIHPNGCVLEEEIIVPETDLIGEAIIEHICPGSGLLGSITFYPESQILLVHIAFGKTILYLMD